MKTTIVLMTLALTMSSAFAKSKDKCSLFLEEPKIMHDLYGRNNGDNAVNAGVVKILMNNGFKITKSKVAAKYTLYTEVRCSQAWTFFGLQDLCKTSIEIYDYEEEKVAYTDGPTPAKPMLAIDYSSVRFPKCSEL